MEFLSRRKFVGNMSLFAAASMTTPNIVFANTPRVKKEDYVALRKQLRTFYPNHCRHAVKDVRQHKSVDKITAEVIQYAKSNPNYDALDLRRECYKSMARNFQPFLFSESPFYFEAGVNGGWSGKCPAFIVERLCKKFYKEQNLIPDEAFALQRVRSNQRFGLCCGPFVDNMHHIPPFRSVLKKGFSGIRAEVAQALEKCPKDDPLGRKQLETALVGLDTIHEIQLSFAKEAKKMLVNPSLDVKARRNFERIAESAQRCPWEKPKTFYEALNTLWFVREILGYTDNVKNYSLGRPDCWFYDLYKQDLAAARLTENEAVDLIARFQIIADCHHDDTIPVNGYDDQEAEIPVSLGGCDKFGKPVYNELTKMFLNTHYDSDCVYPKQHCRIASDSPQEYLLHLGDLLIKGHAVFALLNDDRYIPQWIKQGYTLEDAREYMGCGCWNGYIDSVMDVDSANYVSLVRILELTLYRDAKIEKDARIKIDSIDEAKSYDEVRQITYRNFIRFFRDLLSEFSRYGRANAKVFPHPAYSVCLRGGIENRRDTTDAGIPARPRLVTLGFVGNVADSLLAIKCLCFDKKICTLKELLGVVRNNWKGKLGEELRQAALNAPYWGDGTPESCAEVSWWIKRTYEDIEGFKTDQGNPYHLAIFTYREFMYWGNGTRATPDGRRDGDRLAQGFTPSEYRCREGATTVINAIAALPHECLIASNANLTFEKSAMKPETFAAVFRVYAKKAGHLIQPNCNSVEELLDAQKHPERHQNLIVKVCGFSARFISLSKRWQDEVIARHRLK